MKTIILAISLIALISLPAQSDAEDVVISVNPGFLTGNVYRALTRSAKSNYVVGVIDGVFLAPFYGVEEDMLKPFEDCIIGMTVEQITAIIDLYLEENPERWHGPMHVLVLSALRQTCRTLRDGS